MLQSDVTNLLAPTATSDFYACNRAFSLSQIARNCDQIEPRYHHCLQYQPSELGQALLETQSIIPSKCMIGLQASSKLRYASSLVLEYALHGIIFTRRHQILPALSGLHWNLLWNLNGTNAMLHLRQQIKPSKSCHLRPMHRQGPSPVLASPFPSITITAQIRTMSASPSSKSLPRPPKAIWAQQLWLSEAQGILVSRTSSH